MPRRRKKENGRRKSLLFAESPVERRGQPLSPLACVDNPVTAVAIPVESDSNVSWVSPQFNGVKLSQTQRKRRQARRGSRCKEASHAESSKIQTRSTARCKFPALDFVGDTFQSAQKTGNLRKAAKGGRVTQRKNDTVSEQHVNVENVDHTSRPGKKDVRNRGGDQVCCPVETLRNSNACNSDVNHHQFTARRSTFCVSTNHSSPNESSSEIQIKRPDHDDSRVFTRMRPIQNGTSSAEHSLLCSPLSGDRGKRRKSYSSGILQSPLETSDRPTTPVAALDKIPLKIAMFDSSPTALACFNAGTNYTLLSTSDSNCSPGGALNNYTDTCVAGSPSQIKHHRGLLSVSHAKLSLHNDTCSTEQHKSGSQGLCGGQRLRRSKRLEEKYREALKYLCPRTPEVMAKVILVSDTPECEYGLTYRQKQFTNHGASVSGNKN